MNEFENWKVHKVFEEVKNNEQGVASVRRVKNKDQI